jgi:hypothetical protein
VLLIYQTGTSISTGSKMLKNCGFAVLHIASSFEECQLSGLHIKTVEEKKEGASCV